MARRRSKRGGGKSLNVQITGGLERFEKIPGWLERGPREALRRTGRKIGDDIAQKAPGGPSGSVGRAVDSRVLTNTTLQITVDHPGAKALEGGAYIVARRGRGSAIRFNAGGQRFIRAPFGARIPAFEYGKKGLRRRRTRMQEAHDEVFRDLERSVG